MDTWLLRALVSVDAGERGDALSIISKLEAHPHDIKVPQVALGEAISTIMRDYSDASGAYNALKKLYDHLKRMGISRSSLPPIKIDIVDEAKILKRLDSRLGDTDAIIAAQALLDPVSQKLLTVDTVMLNSKAIADEEIRLRKEGKRCMRMIVTDRL